ncbi:hypothetical protein D3C80_1962720 [compost metagenome]
MGWINQITIIFHNSTGQSGDAPVIEEDLWKGLSDGIAVLKAIAAYRPDALGEDLTFFGNVSSLCNLYNHIHYPQLRLTIQKESFSEGQGVQLAENY